MSVTPSDCDGTALDGWPSRTAVPATVSSKRAVPPHSDSCNSHASTHRANVGLGTQ